MGYIFILDDAKTLRFKELYIFQNYFSSLLITFFQCYLPEASTGLPVSPVLPYSPTKTGIELHSLPHCFYLNLKIVAPCCHVLGLPLNTNMTGSLLITLLQGLFYSGKGLYNFIQPLGFFSFSPKASVMYM